MSRRARVRWLQRGDARRQWPSTSAGDTTVSFLACVVQPGIPIGVVSPSHVASTARAPFVTRTTRANDEWRRAGGVGLLNGPIEKKR